MCVHNAILSYLRINGQVELNVEAIQVLLYIYIYIYYLFYLKFLQTHIYIYIYINISLKDKCNVLCERTDNQASGSREALAVNLIKYNKKHKNNGTYSNTSISKHIQV